MAKPEFAGQPLFACSNLYRSTATVTHFSGELYDVVFTTKNGNEGKQLVRGFDKAVAYAAWLAS